MGRRGGRVRRSGRPGSSLSQRCCLGTHAALTPPLGPPQAAARDSALRWAGSAGLGALHAAGGLRGAPGFARPSPQAASPRERSPLTRTDVTAGTGLMHRNGHDESEMSQNVGRGISTCLARSLQKAK